MLRTRFNWICKWRWFYICLKFFLWTVSLNLTGHVVLYHRYKTPYDMFSSQLWGRVVWSWSSVRNTERSNIRLRNRIRGVSVVTFHISRWSLFSCCFLCWLLLRLSTVPVSIVHISSENVDKIATGCINETMICLYWALIVLPIVV